MFSDRTKQSNFWGEPLGGTKFPHIPLLPTLSERFVGELVSQYKKLKPLRVVSLSIINQSHE
jgi:hypothetical protein